MKIKNIRILAFLAIVFVAAGNFSCTQRTELKALIVTGQNNHNWQISSRYLGDILQKSGLFVTEMKISPEQGKDMSDFIIDFSPYDLVVLDYNGDSWPEETNNNFVEYVKNGGGVVVYHAADNAFPDWQEFNEIIGLGGWGKRDEASGPYVYIKDGEVVRDDSPGGGGTHGAQREFLVHAFQPDHPVMKGLPGKWMHAKDELYANLRGPAQNMEILAWAHSEKTGKDEPVLMTINYGSGRIFHTVLGHAGNERFFPAMECAGFITTLQRGAEWAATGKVSQKVPATFPTETKSIQWEFFEDIYTDITPVVERMREYEFGKSNDCINILKKLVTENINNQEKMEEYHNIIKELLTSEESTDECKMILCKDFSWMANNSYREIYQGLEQDANLADYARYALDRMGE
jgi:uncharacterized protein